MPRPKEFDVDAAIDAAVEVFRERGFEGASAQMLVTAMGIGRKSLYDTFGDKWGVYLAALRRYCRAECEAHRDMLNSHTRAIDGIRAMLYRVVDEVSIGCLGLGSMVEFGRMAPEVVEVRAESGAYLANAMLETLQKARAQGDINPELDLEQLATFFITTTANIRLAARAETTPAHLAAMADLAMRVVR
jgi:AcrR family transcriptional regulator